MDLQNSKKSILINIPTYNAQYTIEETIDSILQQTFQSFRINVFDNCSTDRTLELVSSFNDERISIHRSDSNRGWSWNFGRCLTPSPEEFILIAHADDIYHAQFLEMNVDTLISTEARLLFSAGVDFTGSLKIDYMTKTKETPNVTIYDSYTGLIKKLILNGNFIYAPSLFSYTSDLGRIVKSFNSDCFYGSADLDAWLRFIKEEPIGVIETPKIFFHRISERQTSYNELSSEKSVFVNCMESHLLEAKIDKETKDKLTSDLEWHNVLHDLTKFLISQNCEHFPSFKSFQGAICSSLSTARRIKITALYIGALVVKNGPKLWKKNASMFIMTFVMRA